jgi:hypothetical protein
MPYKRKTAEAQSILKSRNASSPEQLTAEQAVCIAGLVSAAVRNGNACYVQPGRYGSVTVKFYIEGDQFAENLPLSNELEDLCEQIVETLYTQNDVAWNRRAFGTAAPQPVVAASKLRSPTSG